MYSTDLWCVCLLILCCVLTDLWHVCFTDSLLCVCLKVTATWTSVADGSFVVTPESADISPYKTVQFTVSQ